MERAVIINVSAEFRDTIKALKRELTYEHFLNNLLINSGRKISQSDQPRTTKVGKI